MNMLNANTAIKKRSHAEPTVPQKQEIIDWPGFRPGLNKIKEFKLFFSISFWGD
jgi:hypothetical protein